MTTNKIHLIQTELHWEDATANRQQFTDRLTELAVSAGDLVVMPEMFSTGFSMASARLAETMQGDTVNWLRSMSEKLGCDLCGSLIIEDGGKYFNRFIVQRSDGNQMIYDKRHLFRMAGEHNHYASGTENLRFHQGDATLMAQVCYDLRFPVWSRNQSANPYDVLVYVANWPAARREQWRALLRARAIENQCYVVGVNRIGKDGNDVEYAGDSCVFDFTGNTLLDMADKPGTTAFLPDLEALSAYRDTFPAHLDADDFNLVTDYPPSN